MRLIQDRKTNFRTLTSSTVHIIINQFIHSSFINDYHQNISYDYHIH
jgi:hypothetical protein